MGWTVEQAQKVSEIAPTPEGQGTHRNDQGYRPRFGRDRSQWHTRVDRSP